MDKLFESLRSGWGCEVKVTLTARWTGSEWGTLPRPMPFRGMARVLALTRPTFEGPFGSVTWRGELAIHLADDNEDRYRFEVEE